MNLLRALGIGVRPAPPPPENRRVRAKLPEVNAFVDLLVGTNRTRVSVAIDAVDSNEIITRHVAGLAAGMAADFLYTNSLGKFRFVTVCTQAGSKKRIFNYPKRLRRSRRSAIGGPNRASRGSFRCSGDMRPTVRVSVIFSMLR